MPCNGFAKASNYSVDTLAGWPLIVCNNRVLTPAGWNFEEKIPPSLEACKLDGRTSLGLQLWTPFAQAQELPNLSAFVAIFLGFGRSIIGLAEGMFGIADCFVNQVQRLSHTQFLHSP